LQENAIEVVGKDNKTVIQHKVAADVVCMFFEADIQIAACWMTPSLASFDSVCHPPTISQILTVYCQCIV
jgi:hypothetical protein